MIYEVNGSVRRILLLLEDAGAFPLGKAAVNYLVLLCLLAYRQSAQVLFQKRNHGVNVQVAHEVEVEVGGVGKALLVDFQDTVIGNLPDILATHTLGTYVIVIQDAGNTVAQGRLGIHILILQDILQAGHGALVSIVITMGCGEAEVGKLQQGLEILLHATAVQAFCTVGYCRIDRSLNAGQLLVQLRGCEGTPAAQTYHTGIAGAQVFIVGIEAAATPADCLHGNLVGRVVSLLYTYLNAVAQRNHLRTEDIILYTLNLCLGFQLGNQRVIVDFLLEDLNLLGIHLGKGLQDFLLGWILQPFLLRHKEGDGAVLVANQFGEGLVYGFQRQHGNHLLHILVHPLNTGNRFVVQEMAHVLVYVTGILYLVSGLVLCIQPGQVFLLVALVFSLGEASALGT